MGELVKVLITVKTYPQPHEKYKELVCTAGVREDGSFIRLHPIAFRYKPYSQQYKKYQWIELEVEKNEEDKRPESYKQVEGTIIKTIGESISTKKNWADRKKYVLARGVETMCHLEHLSQEQCSLGIIRPKVVEDFIYEETTRVWKPEQQKNLDQQNLFGDNLKPLKKIPYKFRYVFKCEEPNCTGHKKMITDWELGILFLNMYEKHQSEDIALAKVKETFMGKICSSNIDTHFFVGTVNPKKYKAWIVIGTFYPPKGDPELPFDF